MGKGTGKFSGGCLCGAVRYEAHGEPIFAGHCYCLDCQKASGSGFIPFMGFPANAIHFSGPTRQFVSDADYGRVATRNFCSICGSLVFGGELGKSESFAIYAGSLDEPALFEPRVAIYACRRPPWAIIPPGLTVFDRMPPGEGSSSSS